MDAFIEANLRNWESRVPIHTRDSGGFYDVAGFLAGADKLGPIEGEEIGDVAGFDLLHLQCHFGIDTLSLARRGARVTGLDFSPSAIAQARTFAAQTGLAASFMEGSVYDAASLTPGPFDRVFTTWGTIGWLPELKPWALAIAAVLKPGGRFYFCDGHPQLDMLDEKDGKIVLGYPWRNTAAEPCRSEWPVTYTGDPDPLSAPLQYSWAHPVSDILTALMEAGLRLVFIREHEAVPWRPLPSFVKGEDGLWRLPAGAHAMPLALSLMAEKPAA